MLNAHRATATPHSAPHSPLMLNLPKVGTAKGTAAADRTRTVILLLQSSSSTWGAIESWGHPRGVTSPPGGEVKLLIL